MLKTAALCALLCLAACATHPRMKPDEITQGREAVESLTREGRTREAWEAYISLVARSGVPQFPLLLGPLAAATLVQGLEADDPPVRADAMRALAEGDQDLMFAAAVRGLHDSDLRVRTAAVDILRQSGRPEAVELIRPHAYQPVLEQDATLETPQMAQAEELQAHALWGMGALAVKPLPIAPGVSAMSSPHEATRVAGALALGQVGDAAAVPSLRHGLRQDPSRDVQKASARALLDLKRREIVQEFIEDIVINGSLEQVAWAIEVRASEGIGSGPRWIREQSYNPSPEVRAAAAIAMQRIGVEGARGRLEEMAGAKEPLVQVSAAYALAKLGGKMEVKPIPIIESGLKTADAEVRIRMAGYLADLDASAHANIFGVLQGDPRPDVRLAAVRALGKARPEVAARFLGQSLGDPDNTVRFTAAAIIRRID